MGNSQNQNDKKPEPEKPKKPKLTEEMLKKGRRDGGTADGFGGEGNHGAIFRKKQ